jgi:CRP-like cAMP-binding protein
MELLKFLDENKLWKETKTYKRNEFIKLGNTIDTNLYFVVEGSLRVFILHEDEEKVIRFGYKNSLITALDSFLTGEPSLFNIQVIKKTTVKIISKNTFNQLLKEYTFINDIWIKNLETLALQQIEREIDILTNSPKERYLRILKRSPQLFQEIPNKHIASYLRMSPETLSRMKKH